jgi:hypothetical protein
MKYEIQHNRYKSRKERGCCRSRQISGGIIAVAQVYDMNGRLHLGLCIHLSSNETLTTVVALANVRSSAVRNGFLSQNHAHVGLAI